MALDVLRSALRAAAQLLDLTKSQGAKAIELCTAVTIYFPRPCAMRVTNTSIGGRGRGRWQASKHHAHQVPKRL